MRIFGNVAGLGFGAQAFLIHNLTTNSSGQLDSVYE